MSLVIWNLQQVLNSRGKVSFFIIFYIFLLTALLGFITTQNYIKKLLQRKEKRKKDIYTQKGEHERDQRTHARCRPRKLKEEKK